LARKSIDRRQKKVVLPRRVSPAQACRAPVEPRPSRPPRAKGRIAVLLHDSVSRAYGAAIRGVDPRLEAVVLRAGEPKPPQTARARIYLRSWEGGATADLPEILEAAPNLRWMHTPSAGVDHLPLERLRQRGIALTNGRGIHSAALAESVLAFLLARAKAARPHQIAQSARRFVPLRLDALEGRSLLLYGYGAIGRSVAARAAAFAMRVSAVRRAGRLEPPLAKVWRPGELCEAVGGADAVVLAAPLTEETRGAFDGEVFAAMKEECHFVNVARGEIVVERDLIEGLGRGRPAFASLDVFENEPLPADSPFWQMENVAITPHDAWSSPHVKARSLELFASNLRNFLAGRPLRNLVDYRRGY
jgi:phosphoglycerate dehydrogenase-like enzyme